MQIGVDVGGTKIAIVALGPGGRELARRRVATPIGNYEGTVHAVRDLVAAVESSTGARGSVGIGIPGTISPKTGLVKNANSTCLNGRPFDKDLAEALGRPVRVANDANCFALSESTDGAAAGASVVFGVILGTGVGGGLVVEGRAVEGVNRIGGEWGHNPLPRPREGEHPGPLCWCGRNGCIELFLSGPGLARDHEIASGESLAAQEIVARADQGDAMASETLARYEERLARALATVINILDPGVIVLGGGMSNVGRLYANVPRLWEPHVFSDRVDTRLAAPKHGDASGVRGAAWLWPEQP